MTGVGQLELIWKITGIGSADMAWNVGDASISLHTTYVGDGLQSFLSAAADINNGSHASAAVLEGEPGGYLLLLGANGEDVFVQILQFGVIRTWTRSALQWSGLLPKAQFLSAVCTMAAEVLDRHGEAEYARLWGGIPFPMAEYRQLIG